MRALCWMGSNELQVLTVPDPRIMNPQDVIIRVTMSSVCGSDLHLLGGYIPTMRKGDIIGHEFLGEIVDAGPEVRKVRIGDKVVVPSFVVCGKCAFCRNEQWSLCDNTNPNEAMLEAVMGDTIAGVYGYSHMTGGYAGSHAEYIRVPFAENSCFRVPEGIPDEQLVFVSDALPTGYMGADLCGIRPGDTVAVWGCGAVGQAAIQSAYLLGADRVIAIDRFPWRLQAARDHAGAEILNYEEAPVLESLKELTAGRGPDCCIDAVGMEAHGIGLTYLYDRAKQAARLETDRPEVLREAILACRKGGTISIMGVYTGIVDKFPIGAAMNKALTFKMGQQFGQKYAPRLLKLLQEGKLDTSYFTTHKLSLEEGPQGYEIFQRKRENCLRVVFAPGEKRAA